MTVRSLRRFVVCLSITRLPFKNCIRNASMSFGEQRMAMEGRCRTCHACFERMSVLLQDDDGAQRNRGRRWFATDATTLRSQRKMRKDAGVSKFRPGVADRWLL